MKKNSIRYVGLDVHANSISVAVADEGTDAVIPMGMIPNTPNAIARLVKMLGEPRMLRVCYEAGPCGYVVFRQLSKMGVSCVVVAPGLIPVKATDRIKTDKRDAIKLARLFRAGELTAVWVPDDALEALRDLVRAREAAKEDETRARHRLTKFLLRIGRHRPVKMKTTGKAFAAWLDQQKFEHVAHASVFNDYRHELQHATERIKRLENAIVQALAQASEQIQTLTAALQALRGVSTITAVTIATEVGQMSRFRKPSQVMSYSGDVPSEHSSGGKIRRGAITKTGNAHLRRIIGEAAHAYRFRPNIGKAHRKRSEGLSEACKEIAWKAQTRLHDRFRHLTAVGKPQGKALVAVARELMGFAWAIGIEVERELATKRAA
jgi:transposase